MASAVLSELIEKWGWAESGGLAQGLAELLYSLVELDPPWRSALGEVTQELALVVRTRAGSGPRTAIPSPVRGLAEGWTPPYSVWAEVCWACHKLPKLYCQRRRSLFQQPNRLGLLAY